MMAADIRDPMGDIATGAEIMAMETRRHSIMGTAQDSVVDVVEVETGTTAEVAVLEGAMVQTPPPPHQYGQKTRSGGQTGREGGRSE